MAGDVAIKVDHVSKVFKLPHEKNNSIKSAVVNFRHRKKTFEQQEVLKDISFEIKEGEFFGIVGRNGSGKSTLLKMLAGIYSSNGGAIYINGQLTPFIELGVGFNMELTGRENVFLNGALLGFNRQEIEAMYESIVEFAELERFMDQKLKNYSSGMQVRLAFSIAIRANSDILLLDEVLAVGDAIFQQKCFDYFKELKRHKKTVVLVSHDAGALQKYCDKGILIEKGKIVESGPIQGVLTAYQDILIDKEEHTTSRSDGRTMRQTGSGEIQITEALVLNKSDEQQKVFGDDASHITVRVTYKASEDCEQPIYGIIINDADGQEIFASNTEWFKVQPGNIKKDEVLAVQWRIPNVFNTGSYTVTPAVANSAGTLMYDWREELTSFKIRKQLYSSAQMNVAHELSVQPIKNKKG